MSKGIVKKKDLVDLANGTGVKIFHNICVGGEIRFSKNEYSCSNCPTTWRLNWIIYTCTDQGIADRFYLNIPDDNTSTYRLVEVTDGKLRYTKLIKVENSANDILNFELAFDGFLT